MKSLFHGLSSGFGRTIGRIIAYVFIAYIIYLLINHFGIDLSKYINILRGDL